MCPAGRDRRERTAIEVSSMERDAAAMAHRVLPDYDAARELDYDEGAWHQGTGRKRVSIKLRGRLFLCMLTAYTIIQAVLT
jgi:hypothetical protein